MKLIFTCNGYHKKSYDEAVYDLEIPMSDDMYEYIKSLFEDNKLNASNTNETITTVLREISWFNDFIFRHVVGIAKKENFVYIVQFDWSTTDCDGIETYLYYRHEDALDKFNELIENESDADLSWVGSEVFDENGDVNDGYDLECNTDDENAESLYWHVVDKSDYNRRSFIELFKREIH